MGKLIFFDIDGTLRAEEDGFLPQSTVDAIAAVRANGHQTFINTGRTAMNVREDIRFLGFDGYICGCGTEILYHDQVLLRCPTHHGQCQALAEEILACNAVPLYERSDALFRDDRARTLAGFSALMALYQKQGVPVQSMQAAGADFSFDKFVIWYDADTDMTRFRQAIAAQYAFIDRGYGFAEITPLGYSKGTGMQMLVQHLGASMEDTIAIGDSLNDVEMLQVAHVGVAMGNGARLHPCADFITKDLKADGIFYAMKSLGLLEET